MSMFRHDYESPNMNFMLLSGEVEGFYEILSRSLLRKKFSTLETREGQLMCITRRVEALSSFAMARRGIHIFTRM